MATVQLVPTSVLVYGLTTDKAEVNHSFSMQELADDGAITFAWTGREHGVATVTSKARREAMALTSDFLRVKHGGESGTGNATPFFLLGQSAFRALKQSEATVTFPSGEAVKLVRKAKPGKVSLRVNGGNSVKLDALFASSEDGKVELAVFDDEQVPVVLRLVAGGTRWVLIRAEDLFTL